jgi:hypothetical protein
MLQELSQSHLTVVKDLSRVMNRLKAVYRSLGDSLRRQRGLLHPALSSVAGKNPSGHVVVQLVGQSSVSPECQSVPPRKHRSQHLRKNRLSPKSERSVYRLSES